MPIYYLLVRFGHGPSFGAAIPLQHIGRCKCDPNLVCTCTRISITFEALMRASGSTIHTMVWCPTCFRPQLNSTVICMRAKRASHHILFYIADTGWRKTFTPPGITPRSAIAVISVMNFRSLPISNCGNITASRQIK